MIATVVALFASFAATPSAASAEDDATPEVDAAATAAVEICDTDALMLGDPPEPTDGPPMSGASDPVLPLEAGRFGVYVEPGLLEDIDAAVDQYVVDLRLEGYDPFVREFAGSAAGLRSDLRSEHLDGMVGALFVGDLPTFEFTSPSGPFSETYLHDLYFMDLDGTYVDAAPYDVHRDGSGDVEPEIYVSRITAEPVLWLTGGSEAEAVNDYFARVHAYRTGDLTYANRGAAFADADWSTYDWAAAMEALYPAPDVDSVHSLAASTPTNYVSLIQEDHESLVHAVHGGGNVMHFYAAPAYLGYEGSLSSQDLLIFGAQPGFYNMFTCSAGDFSGDSLLGAAVIANERGLHGISSTKPGGIAQFDNYWYYAPLGEYATVGQAFLEFFQTHTGSTEVPGEEHLISWLGGMTMQGDPTLVPATMGDGPASIAGEKWDDVDGDGERDAGESGLSGWTIFLDQNENGVRDAWEPAEVTGADGSYEFTGLAPGRYVVAEEVPANWLQTSPRTIVDYTALTSDDVGGPTFDWMDISTTGVGLPLGDDDHLEVLLPFVFPFYDEDAVAVGVASNGFLLLSDRSGAFEYMNTGIPDPTPPNGIIAGFWDDLNPPVGGTVYAGLDASDSRFVVQYDDVPLYPDVGEHNFQIVLERDGTELVQYLDMDGDTTSATVGIERQDGLDGLQVAHDEAFVSDGLAVRFDPVFAGTRARVAYVLSGDSVSGIDFGNLDAPGAPRDLAVTVSDDSVTATWDPPAGDGGVVVDGYRVELDPGDVVQNVTGTTATFTGLAPGDYSVTVQASNAAGLGPAVTESTLRILGDRVGYMMLRTDGVIHGFGDATVLGNVSSVDDAVKIVSNADGTGYWVLDEGGRVHAFGVSHFGDLTATSRAGWLPGEQPAALSVMPDELGYWIFTDRGRAFEFGSAGDHGDLVELGLAPILNGPVVDSVSTPDGLGYYMVAADGGVFSFGTAEFHGSMGGLRLNEPVNALVPDPDNDGYWLIAFDGGVFAFDAPFVGSVPGVLAPGVSLNAPVIGGLAYGNGYLMVATDGGIFSFSDLPFLGSLGSNPPPSPVVSVAAFTS